MAIAGTSGNTRLTLRATPQFVADTLTEITAAVAADAVTYEGKYIRVLDQVAGQQLYIALEGVLYPANDQAGFAYDFDVDKERFFSSNGTEITSVVAWQKFSATTDANGRITLNATQDGTANGAAMFSEIFMVEAVGVGIQANTYDMIMRGEYAITNSKNITVQMIRGSNTTVLIGGVVNSIRTAPANRTVQAVVMGIKA